MHIGRKIFALAPATIAIAVAGCGGTGSTYNTGKTTAVAGNSPAVATPPSGTIGLATNKFGKVLVDSHGRSLYLFEKDKSTASTCYGACASVWPPLTVSGKPSAGAGVATAQLGTTKRTDGQTEVTYNGHPLYYYVSDTAPGQITGEGLNQFGAVWDLVAPTGKKIESGH
jgi:predicted lipoprotein with Yx(FWY)xxD motif